MILILPWFVPSRCELLLLPLLAELVRYCLCARANTHLCETGRLLHPPSTVLGSFFGKRLSVATLESSFGEQLWGATLQLCSSIDEQFLKNDRFGE